MLKVAFLRSGLFKQFKVLSTKTVMQFMQIGWNDANNLFLPANLAVLKSTSSALWTALYILRVRISFQW